MALGTSVAWLTGGEPILEPTSDTESVPDASLFDLVSRIVALPRDDRAALLRLLQSEAQATG